MSDDLHTKESDVAQTIIVTALRDALLSRRVAVQTLCKSHEILTGATLAAFATFIGSFAAVAMPGDADAVLRTFFEVLVIRHRQAKEELANMSAAERAVAESQWGRR